MCIKCIEQLKIYLLFNFKEEADCRHRRSNEKVAKSQAVPAAAEQALVEVQIQLDLVCDSLELHLANAARAVQDVKAVWDKEHEVVQQESQRLQTALEARERLATAWRAVGESLDQVYTLYTTYASKILTSKPDSSAPLLN